MGDDAARLGQPRRPRLSSNTKGPSRDDVAEAEIVQGDQGGETATISESLMTVNDAAGVAPKWTAVAPVKRDPVITTGVPPAAGPLLGSRPVTIGAKGFRGESWVTGAMQGGKGYRIRPLASARYRKSARIKHITKPLPHGGAMVEIPVRRINTEASHRSKECPSPRSCRLRFDANATLAASMLARNGERHVPPQFD